MVLCCVCGEPRREGMDCELCKQRRNQALEQIRERFPNANYAPREGCKYCGGTGVRKPTIPCICIYVDHEICDFAAEGLAETAKKIREELKL